MTDKRKEFIIGLSTALFLLVTTPSISVAGDEPPAGGATDNQETIPDKPSTDAPATGGAGEQSDTTTQNTAPPSGSASDTGGGG